MWAPGDQLAMFVDAGEVVAALGNGRLWSNDGPPDACLCESKVNEAARSGLAAAIEDGGVTRPVLVFYRPGVRWPLLADGHRRVCVAAALGRLVPVAHTANIDEWIESRTRRWVRGIGARTVQVRPVDREASRRRGYLVRAAI